MRTFKSIVLSFSMFFFWNSVVAQEWAPIGAEWDYGYQEFYMPSGLFWYHLEVEKDTVINSISCRKIVQTNTDPDGVVEQNNLFTYEINDSVFYYYSHTDAFHLIYDFVANVGDTLTLTGYDNDPDYPVRVRLDSITNITTNNGVDLKKYYYSDPYNYSLPYKTLVQGIGNLNGVRNIYGVFAYEPPITELRCFKSNEIEYSISDDCDYFGPVGTSNIFRSDIKVFPNPVADYLYISNEEALGIYNYSLVNINGQLVLQEAIYSDGINMSTVPAGVYILIIKNNDGERWAERVVRI